MLNAKRPAPHFAKRTPRAASDRPAIPSRTDSDDPVLYPGICKLCDRALQKSSGLARAEEPAADEQSRPKLARIILRERLSARWPFHTALRRSRECPTAHPPFRRGFALVRGTDMFPALRRNRS